MLFVCRLVCYQTLVWFKNKKIKEKRSCVLFYMYPPAPEGSNICFIRARFVDTQKEKAYGGGRRDYQTSFAYCD